jgi:hypothetical protein
LLPLAIEGDEGIEITVPSQVLNVVLRIRFCFYGRRLSKLTPKRRRQILNPNLLSVLISLPILGALVDPRNKELSAAQVAFLRSKSITKGNAITWPMVLAYPSDAKALAGRLIQEPDGYLPSLSVESWLQSA